MAPKKPKINRGDKIYGWPVKSQRSLADGLSAVYTVLLWSSGELTCDCPGWIFQHAKPAFEGCKHIRRVNGDESAENHPKKLINLFKAGEPLPAVDEEGKPSSGTLPQISAGTVDKPAESKIKFGRVLYLGD